MPSGAGLACGKGDFLEGGVPVPAMAWWPGVIAPGQIVGDIIHVTDLFTPSRASTTRRVIRRAFFV